MRQPRAPCWVMRPAVLLLAGCAVALVACTTSQLQARPAQRRGIPLAWSLLGAPGRLMDRPVASTGCGWDQ